VAPVPLLELLFGERKNPPAPMACSASAPAYRPPDESKFPLHDRTIRVTQYARICIGKRKINLSTVFAGPRVGIREVADEIWLVSFMDYALEFFDQEKGRVEPAPNPFALEKVLTMSPA